MASQAAPPRRGAVRVTVLSELFVLFEPGLEQHAATCIDSHRGGQLLNKLILGNLVHRPLRSVISALAVAIEVIMILSIVGIMYGILNGSRDQQNGTGMDLVVRPGQGSAILSASSASASVRVADVLKALPHVEVAAPVNIKMTLGSSVQNLYGIDYPSYNALRPFVFVTGTPFAGPDDMLVDDLEAASKHLAVGTTVKALNHTFRVCGIVKHGKGARQFVPLTTLDELDGNPGKASAFLLRTDDHGKTMTQTEETVRREIHATQGLSDWSVQTREELLSQLTPDHIPAFNIGVRVVIGIAAVIGFLVIFQSMYTAVMERTREIGVLKSMGAGNGTIVSVVLRETGLLAVTGVVLGIIATYGLRAVLRARFPTLSFQFDLSWVGIAAAITLLGALFGALYPAWKAARKDPIEALAYE